MATLGPSERSDSMFMIQQYAALERAMFPCPPLPPLRQRSSTPAYFTAGITGPLSTFEKRDSCAAKAFWNVMWNGVVKVTVLPLTDWTSMTWPTGRLGRENQVREASPGGDLVLHSVMLVSVSSSISTISLAARPLGTLASIARVLPLIASAARLVDSVNLKYWVPTLIRFAFVPTGIFSLVWVGPRPRSTIPFVIWRVAVILKSPAESCTTWPTGQSSSAAWMPAVASCEPLPY